jgi:hypothetical protein
LISVFKIADKFKILEDDHRFHTQDEQLDELDAGLNQGGYLFSLEEFGGQSAAEELGDLPTKIRYSMYW